MRFRSGPGGVKGGLRLAAVLVLLTAVFAIAAPIVAEAKTPGKSYCFNGICHRVKTLSEMRSLVGSRVSLKASYYDSCKRDRFNPCGLTSSGEEFRHWSADNAASPVYPNGTKLLVWHPGTKKAVVVRINNSGPYHGSRNLDLSRAAAERLGFAGSGIASLQAKVLSAPSESEARYSRGRSYASVPGYIGTHGSIDQAVASVSGGSGSTRFASSDRPAQRRAVGMGRGTGKAKPAPKT